MKSWAESSLRLMIQTQDLEPYATPEMMTGAKQLRQSTIRLADM